MEVTNDVANFSVISSDFGKDSKHIYYTYRALDNVHHGTFYWDEKNGLPKDKKHVYLPTTETNSLTIIKGADPKTYEKVNLDESCLHWYRDKNFYFYNHEKTAADRNTLSFEAPFLPYDKTYVFSVDDGKVKKTAHSGPITVMGKNILRDSKTFYYKADCDSTHKRINYEDENTFKYFTMDESVFRIDNHIYVLGIIILSDQFDIDSYEILKYNYSKDKNQVYYKSSVLVGADASTFKILNEQYAKDSKNVYETGKILDGYNPMTFVRDRWDRYPTSKDYGKSPRSISRSWGHDDDD